MIGYKNYSYKNLLYILDNVAYATKSD